MSGVMPTFFCLAVALIFGGGGASSPVSELIVQLLTAAGFIVWLWQRQKSAQAAIPTAVWLTGALILIIPLLQLVPLPPALWHALPGREVERQALALIGQQDSWRPISMFPGRTLASMLAMVASVALIPMASALTREQIGMMLAGVVGLALLSVVVGVCQMAGVVPLRFYLPYQSLPVGFQASRNFQAEVLNIALLCAGAVPRLILGRRRMAELAVRVVSINVFLLLLVETAQVLGASRMGLALSVPAMAGQMLFLRPALRRMLNRRLALSGLALGALLLAGALVAAGDAQDALGRYAETDHTRLRLRGEAMAIGAGLAPVGGGMGTFLPLYEANEPLNEVSPLYISRAHDDYLELMVETGWSGFAMLACVLALWGWQARCLWRSGNDGARTLCLLSFFSLALIALHSIVDYPLRSMTLAALSAAMTGLIFYRDAVSHPAGGAQYSPVTKVRE
jgi:hypothetical protein